MPAQGMKVRSGEESESALKKKRRDSLHNHIIVWLVVLSSSEQDYRNYTSQSSLASSGSMEVSYFKIYANRSLLQLPNKINLVDVVIFKVV